MAVTDDLGVVGDGGSPLEFCSDEGRKLDGADALQPPMPVAAAEE